MCFMGVNNLCVCVFMFVVGVRSRSENMIQTSYLARLMGKDFDRVEFIRLWHGHLSFTF